MPSEELAPLLKLFDPANAYPKDRPDGSTGAYFRWTNCFTPETGRSPTRRVGNTLHEDCRPDTLYSWQADKGVQRFAQAASGAKWASSFPQTSLYTHINPAATFAYGLRAIRIKLKEGTKFKVSFLAEKEPSDFCSGFLKQTEWADTVAVRVFGGGTDYILCSPGPIESWSMGTTTHYDEIVSSARWYFEQAERHNWIPYRQILPVIPEIGIDPLFISDDEGRDFDGHPFTQEQFAQSLHYHRDHVAEAKITYAPGVPADPARHFATSKPIYWNSRGAGAAAPGANKSQSEGVRDEVCGYSLNYPAQLFTLDLTPGELSAQGNDGRGSFNVGCEPVGKKSLEALYKEHTDGDASVSYRKLLPAQNAFVSSGKRGIMIYYSKSVLAKGTLKTLYFLYEEGAKATYDAAVREVTKSFVSLP